MKNKYANGTHFSKCKFRQLLKMFCNDFTALQIASLTHLNRNTVNMWINSGPRKIAKFLYVPLQRHRIRELQQV